MTVKIEPCKLAGCVQAPPSKSYAHRLMIAAGLAEGASVVRGVENSRDMEATRGCLAALGVQSRIDKNELYITGKARQDGESPVFPCGESGTTLRFFLPIALTKAVTGTFCGSARLMERGIGIYEEIFREKGVEVNKTDESIVVKGQLTPGDYTLAGNVSSQFVSGLLFALPLLGGDSRIRLLPPVESRPYIGMTMDVLKRAGIVVHAEDENCCLIPGGQHYQAAAYEVEGDWSNAAALYAFRAIGGDVSVTGLHRDSLQGDRACLRFLEMLDGENPVMDLADTPDLAPVLFAAAAAKHGAVFTGIRRLRIKESDRAACMAEELLKCGIYSEMEENRMIIRQGTLHSPKERFSAHNDHRIVMALSLLASLVGGEIEGAEAVSKSWPGYFDVLRALGCRLSLED